MTNESRLRPSDMRSEGEIDESDDWGRAPAKTLTPREAAALRGRWSSMSPWMVVSVQAVAGLVVAVLTWLVTGSGVVAASALWGAAVVVLPAALLARGMAQSLRAGARAAALGFVIWELMKMGVAVAMLATSVWIVPGLSWPALLVAMLVCMKMNWLALLWQGRKTNRS